MNTSGAKKTTPLAKATGMVIELDTFTVWMTDGRRITIPLKCFPRLDRATPAERRNFEIHAEGRILSWPGIDEDIEVQHIVDGRLPIKLDQPSARVAEEGVAYRTKRRR